MCHIVIRCACLPFPTLPTMRYITDFQIRDGDGQIQNAQIDNLQLLSNRIRRYGPFEMQKVSFYITDDENPNEFRNVILRCRRDAYIPEFCDEDLQKQQADWSLVAKALQYRNLDDQFVKYIRLPWIAAP